MPSVWVPVFFFFLPNYAQLDYSHQILSIRTIALPRGVGNAMFYLKNKILTYFIILFIATIVVRATLVQPQRQMYVATFRRCINQQRNKTSMKWRPDQNDCSLFCNFNCNGDVPKL